MMVYRTIIHLNIELQIPVIYRADFGLRGFTPLARKLLLLSTLLLMATQAILKLLMVFSGL